VNTGLSAAATSTQAYRRSSGDARELMRCGWRIEDNEENEEKMEN
jgi:hypothetical protein